MEDTRLNDHSSHRRRGAQTRDQSEAAIMFRRLLHANNESIRNLDRYLTDSQQSVAGSLLFPLTSGLGVCPL